MRVTPYLFFNGTCRDAFTFYARTLGAPAPHFMTFADMPAPARASMPGVADTAVMHVALVHGTLRLFGSDDPSGTGTAMAGNAVHLELSSPEQTQRVFTAFSDGGVVDMPLAGTFWTPAFGTLTDRYGIRWMVSLATDDRNASR